MTSTRAPLRTHSWVGSLLWGAVACGAPAEVGRDPEPPIEPVPVDVAQSSAAASRPEVEPIEGSESLLKAGGLVMLGELHGTVQIPAFVGDLAELAAAKGLSVRLGLEIPRSETGALEAYLASEGSEADRQRLLQSPHWRHEFQDGRSSEAMLELVERVRRVRAAGTDVELFAFDVDQPGGPGERDAGMAARVLEVAASEPDALVLCLSGNLHNRLSPPKWKQEMVPMGAHVLEARPDAISLDVRYDGGTAWVCTPECGVSELRGKARPARRVWLEGEAPDGYHGTFSIGMSEASVPAVGVDDGGG